MAEEMRFHLEMRKEDKIEDGLSSEEAGYAAQRKFGNLGAVQEQIRHQRGWHWLEALWKDMCYALRTLRKSPGFTLTALATLTIGIGVATVVFNLTAWILFRADPYPNPEQLYRIGYSDKQAPFIPVRTGLHFQAYQERTDVFSEYAAVSPEMANVVIEGQPSAVGVLRTSVDCFRTLGIVPVLGRSFLPEEFEAGANNVVIIDDLFWRTNFHADPQILGRKLLIDQQVCTVIGVLKPGQPFPPAFEGAVYRPLVMNPKPAEPFDPTLFIIGRLRPGVGPEAARAALAEIKLDGLPNWAVPYFAEQDVRLAKPRELARPEAFWLMAIAAAFLYGIACLNTINLILVRQLGRAREISIRLAVGATRGRIVRLLAIESLALSLVVMGILALAARWLFPPLFAAITGSEALRYLSYWNWDILGAGGVLTALACLSAVLVPLARLLGTDVGPNLKEGGAGAGESRRAGQVRNVLVILQAALAVILLTGTGLMVRSFVKLQKVDLGFDPTGKVKAQIAFPKSYILAPEARLQLFERLQQRLEQLPGVKAVSFGQDTLLEGGFMGTAQVQMPNGEFLPVAGNFVSADFLAASGMTLLRGRWLSPQRGEVEVVINESLAKVRFGDRDPIGSSIKLLVSGDRAYSVVGVVRDVKETVRTTAPGLRFYTPSWVYPPNINTVFLKLEKNPEPAFGGLVRRVIYDFDPRLIVTNVSAIDEMVDRSMWAERYAFRIMKGLTVIALGLVVVGLFSVVTYAVASRRREFGVRMALGATPADLRRLVLAKGLSSAAVGIIIGTTVALGLTRFMRSLLFETDAYDPAVFAGVALVLLASAVIACWLPAGRAARTDPVIALRAD